MNVLLAFLMLGLLFWTLVHGDCDVQNRWIMSNHSCIRLEESRQNWAEARRACKNMSSDLASLPSNLHDKTLLENLGSGPYWVGYQNSASSSDPGWVDGTPEMDITRFQATTSSNPFLCGCVLVKSNNLRHYLEWQLENCANSYPFICKTPSTEKEEFKHTLPHPQRPNAAFKDILVLSAPLTPIALRRLFLAGTGSRRLKRRSHDESICCWTVSRTGERLLFSDSRCGDTHNSQTWRISCGTALLTSSRYLTTTTSLPVTREHTSRKHHSRTTSVPATSKVTTPVFTTSQSPSHTSVLLDNSSNAHFQSSLLFINSTLLPSRTVRRAANPSTGVHQGKNSEARSKTPSWPKTSLASTTRRVLVSSVSSTAQQAFSITSVVHSSTARQAYSTTVVHSSETNNFYLPKVTTSGQNLSTTTLETSTGSEETQSTMTSETVIPTTHSSTPDATSTRSSYTLVESTPGFITEVSSDDLTASQTSESYVQTTSRSPEFKALVDFVTSSECNMSSDCLVHILFISNVSMTTKVEWLLSDLIDFNTSMRGETNNRTYREDKWRNSLEFIFWVVNEYLSGSHNGYTPSTNTELEEILESLGTLLGFFVVNMDLKDSLHGSLSYLDFQVIRTNQTELEKFRFQDSRNTCNVSDVELVNGETLNKKHDVILVSVVMQIPTISTKMGNGDASGQGVIASPVLLLSGFVDGARSSLRHKFRIRQNLEDVTNNTYIPLCVYLETDLGVWSTYGCTLQDQFPDEDVVKCSCNHTSNFAVLMQIVPFEMSEVHSMALSIITYIGCSVTLITQFIAITVFTCVGSLNSERVCVHRNLCIAIVGAQITFLAGIEAVENRLVCAIVALLLHYWYTAVFIWMLVEGLHLYSMVVRVFGTERSRMIYYFCFGWGVPVILVTISAAADWEGYGTPTSCWLSTSRNTIWAFVGPALSIIIVNLVILGAVVRIVMASAKHDKSGYFERIRAGVKAAFLLLPLLGLTWVFGLIAVNQYLIVFQYLFAIFNTLQGFFIFLFHCAFNTEVRQALRRLQEKRSLQRGDLSSLAGFSSSPSVSPTPSAHERKKPYGRGDSRFYLSADYRVNRVLPAGYTTTTNITSNTTTTMNGNNNHECRRGTDDMFYRPEEMALMFI